MAEQIVWETVPGSRFLLPNAAIDKSARQDSRLFPSWQMISMHTQKPDEIRNQLQIIRFFDLRHVFFQASIHALNLRHSFFLISSLLLVSKYSRLVSFYQI